MSKKIVLTRGFVAIVDDEDYERLCCLKWHVHINKSGNKYAIHTTSRKLGPRQRQVRMHRFIMNLPDNDPNYVDHIDNDGLNNQKMNLRICTPSQNSANRVSRGGASKYLGVSFYKRNNKWGVNLAKDGRQHFAGLYITEAEAALAYNKKAIELHGRFAKLNTIRQCV